MLAWHFEGPLSEGTLRDLFELRKVIEPSAAALAAVRGDTGLRIALTEALAGMTEATPEHERWGASMLQFHEAILRSGGNEFLSALWPSIQIVLQWTANLHSAAEPLDFGYDWRGDYTRLLDKIISRDPEGAMVAMASLIDGTMLETLLLGRLEPATAGEPA